MQNVCNFPPTFTIVFKLTIFIIEIAVRCTWTLAAVAYFVCSTSELTKLSIPPTIENYTADIWVAFINPLFSITAKKKFLGITYSKNGFLKLFENLFFQELLPFFYIYLRFLCSFEEQLRKTQLR